jgi:ribonuclease-3
MSSLKPLMRALKYEFRDEKLLARALTHRSASAIHNERLEFLGDSLLNYIIAQNLFLHFERATEGELTRLRAKFVKGETLSEIATELGVSQYLRLGIGELRSGGKQRPSILADALEAIIAAIYLDSDLETCKQQVEGWFGARLSESSLIHDQKDSKTRLQEYLQARKKALPEYEVLSIEGEAHAQIFRVICKIDLLDKPTEGIANSRRKAEQQAAARALRLLSSES